MAHAIPFIYSPQQIALLKMLEGIQKVMKMYIDTSAKYTTGAPIIHKHLARLVSSTLAPHEKTNEIRVYVHLPKSNKIHQSILRDTGMKTVVIHILSLCTLKSPVLFFLNIIILHFFSLA